LRMCCAARFKFSDAVGESMIDCRSVRETVDRPPATKLKFWRSCASAGPVPAATYAFLRYSTFGKAIRATAQHAPTTATMMPGDRS
jgi:hypothetical protein